MVKVHPSLAQVDAGVRYTTIIHSYGNESVAKRLTPDYVRVLKPNQNNLGRTSFPANLDGQRGRLSVLDFARLFGAAPQDLFHTARRMIRRHDLGDRYLTRKQRDEVILAVQKRINSPTLTVAGDKVARSRRESE